MKLEQANEAICRRLPVIYKGVEYKLTAVIKRIHYKEARWYYQAELQSITAKSSILIADLEQVELKECRN